MSNIDRYVSNILRTYAYANSEDCAIGSAWYPTIQQLAIELCPENPYRSAGVLAMFSARTPWERNKQLARILFETGKAPGHIFSSHAQRLLDGEPVFDVIKGDKTRSFTIAIATGGNGDIATIDGHAYDIADGFRWGIRRPGIGKRVYADMATAYSEAAIVTATKPNEIQAITWVAYRRMNNFDWHGVL